MVYKKYSTTIKSYPNYSQDLVKGPTETNKTENQYSILDEDGICSPGEQITAGKIYVNKYIPNNAFSCDIIDGNKGNQSYDHKPSRYTGTPGVVDRGKQKKKS